MKRTALIPLLLALAACAVPQPKDIPVEKFHYSKPLLVRKSLPNGNLAIFSFLPPDGWGTDKQMRWPVTFFEAIPAFRPVNPPEWQKKELKVPEAYLDNAITIAVFPRNRFNPDDLGERHFAFDLEDYIKAEAAEEAGRYKLMGFTGYGMSFDQMLWLNRGRQAMLYRVRKPDQAVGYVNDDMVAYIYQTDSQAVIELSLVRGQEKLFNREYEGDFLRMVQSVDF